MSIAGSGFDPEPVASAAACGGSLFPGTALHFHVQGAKSGGFNAGASGNLLGLVVTTYAGSSVAYSFGTGGCGYPTFGKVMQGDTFTVDVNGASCTGIVDYTKPVQCAPALPQDTTPPVLSLPTDMVVDATGPAGAVVVYLATSNDDDGHAYPVSCTPASGSIFAIGSTTVSCQATDAAGNTAYGSFSVAVEDAAGQLADLIARVQGLGPGRSLAAKLQNALARLQAGDTRSACNLLASFTNEVRAQTGKWLSGTQADALVADASRIRAVIGC